MIVLYHQNNRVTKVVSANEESIVVQTNKNIAAVLMALSYQFPEAKIIWCHQLLENSLNMDKIAALFHHNKMMLSYTTTDTAFLGNGIGFVEESPFIKVNKKCTYPTWLMSSEVGVIHASTLRLIGSTIKADANFDYFLNSVAKVGMIWGLLCYSEPQLLLKNAAQHHPQKANLFVLFQFVKQHYKKRWIVLLFFNLLIFEKRFPLLPLLYSLFFKSRKKKELNLDAIPVQSTLTVADKKTIDVIIPTIGRKNYLYDVLYDLAQQTHLPVHVIIVEQNPQPNSQSELDYIENEVWPFKIKHTFTNQPGACNARNIALSQVESEWVFLADDDIRFECDFINKTFKAILEYGAIAVTINCLQKGQIQILKSIFQWSTFGSGCSFILFEPLKSIRFNMGFEFGFGEDADFGMQLRNQGADILYLPEPSILHLKAPIGGFRTKPPLQWREDNMQPKPSPTVMLFQIVHNTQEQIRGYKTILFFKYYKHQKIKNPIAYFINFQKQWDKSVFWANQLKKQNEV